jgi:gas vesicle protein
MANERRDYLVAFLIGAVVGVGATVLLAPPPAKKKRLVRPLQRGARRLRRRSRLRRLIPGR